MMRRSKERAKEKRAQERSLFLVTAHPRFCIFLSLRKIQNLGHRPIKTTSPEAHPPLHHTQTHTEEQMHIQREAENNLHSQNKREREKVEKEKKKMSSSPSHQRTSKENEQMKRGLFASRQHEVSHLPVTEKETKPRGDDCEKTRFICTSSGRGKCATSET